MELALCISAFIFALVAMVMGIWNTILIQAQRQSTHTVIPVSPETATTKLEAHLNKIMEGASQEDLNRNLAKMGLDVDELV